MKEPKQRSADKSAAKTVLWLSAIGIDFAGCAVAGYFLGAFLKGWLGGQLWLVFGLFLGIGAGIWSAAVLIKKVIGA